MLPPWASTNCSDCTNMPPEPQHGIVDAALVGFEHLDEHADDAARACRTRRPACLRPAANLPRKYS